MISPRVRRLVLLAAERSLALLVGAGLGVACGLRDGFVPGSSVLHYATPLPLLTLGALVGAILARARGGRRRAWAWALLLGALLVTLRARDLGPGAPPPPSNAAPAQTLRVLTWNLHGGQAGQERLLQAMDALDADLLCLGEVGRGAGALSFVAGLEGALRARGYLTRTWPQARLLIALRAEGGHLGKQRWHSVLNARALEVDAEWRGRPLHVLLADFRSLPHLDRGPGAAAILELLVQRPDPWICAGDFNTPKTSRCFDPWRAAGAVEAFEAAGEGYAPTWPAPFPVLTLDQIWSMGLAPARASAPIRAESDHCPVWADLRWEARSR